MQDEPSQWESPITPPTHTHTFLGHMHRSKETEQQQLFREDHQQTQTQSAGGGRFFFLCFWSFDLTGSVSYKCLCEQQQLPVFIPNSSLQSSSHNYPPY